MPTPELRLSRRDFLKFWAGAGAATTAETLLTGCAKVFPPSNPELLQAPPRASIPEPRIVPTPPPPSTPELEAKRIKEFEIGTTNFILNENIPVEGGEKIKTLFEEAYPQLKELFGFEPLPMPGKERLTVHLVSGKWEGEGAEHKSDGLVTGFDENGQRIMYLKKPEEDSFTAIHELAHLFLPYSCEGRYDLVDEGFAVLAELVVGKREKFLLNRLGPAFDPEPFINQAGIAAFSYSLMGELRYLAAGLFWEEIYSKDPKFFAKFNKAVTERLEQGTPPTIGELPAIAGEVFNGDFEEIVSRHPIAQMPTPGRKIAFAPTNKGETLVLCCWESNGTEESPLPNTKVELIFRVQNENKNLTFEDHISSNTKNLGVVKLFSPPYHTKERIPPDLKTHQMEIIANAGPDIPEMQITLSLPPLFIEKIPKSYDPGS